MGCDWHPYFDYWDGIQWINHPDFPFVPDFGFWWENILDEDINSGVAQTAHCCADSEEAYVKHREYLKSISLDKVFELYGHRNIYGGTDFKTVTGKAYPNFLYRDYYWFGALANVRVDIADPVIPQYDDIPNNVYCPIRNLYKSMGCGAHTPGWCMVSDLLDLESEFISFRKDCYKELYIETEREMGRIKSSNNGIPDSHLIQSIQKNLNQLEIYMVDKTWDKLEWLKKYIKDPHNTRLIFWFDN